METSRRVREAENLPILLELVRFSDPDRIPTAKIAKQFQTTQGRIAGLIRGLRNGTNSWARVSAAYHLSESQRPPWIGAGTTLPTPPPRPSHTPGRTAPVEEGGQPSGRTLACTHASMQGGQPGRVVPAHGYILPPQAKPESTKRIITFSSITGDEQYVQLEWPNGHQELQRLEGEDLAAYQTESDPTSISALIQRQHEKNYLLIERQQEETRKEIERAREVNRKLLERVCKNL